MYARPEIERLKETKELGQLRCVCVLIRRAIGSRAVSMTCSKAMRS